MAKRVFPLIVWHANHNDGRTDPSQELLAEELEVDVRGVRRAIHNLIAAGFITVVREPRPHHSAAYQIQWDQLEEAHRRWEEDEFAIMKARHRGRKDKAAKFKAAPKATDILPPAMKCSRSKRPGYPGQFDPLRVCPNPGQFDPPVCFSR
jgi:DNA-binding transcriptional regulator YhcF (GntR family)